MKNCFFLYFITLKIFFLSNRFTSSLGNWKGQDYKKGECRKDNSSLLNSCLNNINIFENTNGDIYLGANWNKINFWIHIF